MVRPHDRISMIRETDITRLPTWTSVDIAKHMSNQYRNEQSGVIIVRKPSLVNIMVFQH